MDQACATLTDTGGEAGVPCEIPSSPWSLGATNSDGFPEDRDEHLEELADPGEPESQDVPDSMTSQRDDSSFFPPAAKRLKTDSKEKEKRPIADEEEAQRMTALLSSLSKEQLTRYALYRQSAFPKALIKSLMQSIAGRSMSQNVVITMAGLAKVFVGEVVEEALDVCEKWGEMPPLQPKHLREAVRRLNSKGRIPSTKYKKIRFF
nr:transcription initiation factor TFIID subunit 11 [Oryctolagus cuniculus]